MSAEDEERRKGLKPVVDIATAVHIAHQIWGLRVADDDDPPRPLESYDDCNFYMPGILPTSLEPSQQRQKYLLKIQNGVESRTPEVLAFQHATMARLTAAGLSCPRPVPLPPSVPPPRPSSTPASTEKAMAPASSHTVFHTLPVRAGPATPLAVRLFHWVEGTPLVDVPFPPLPPPSSPPPASLPPSLPPQAAALLAAGRYLSRIEQALTGFDHPGSHRRHMWDVRHFASLRPWTRYLPEEGGKRALVVSVLEAFVREVVPVAEGGGEGLRMDSSQAGEERAVAGFREGVIMGDWNDANIIVAPRAPSQVRGLIDLGDALWSWQVNEVAIAMAYAAVSALGKAYPVQAAALLLRGWAAGSSTLPR
ncbi:aminotransferase class-iii, partial [Nannochloropsis gaditana CCMP526]|uniref:aminotransferase class-iii n=1 Tax=Nannochloropsis gaditana (strain CCMP526) TaxID=1093141 RepID=UPI00029F62ED